MQQPLNLPVMLVDKASASTTYDIRVTCRRAGFRTLRLLELIAQVVLHELTGTTHYIPWTPPSVDGQQPSIALMPLDDKVPILGILDDRPAQNQPRQHAAVQDFLRKKTRRPIAFWPNPRPNPNQNPALHQEADLGRYE